MRTPVLSGWLLAALIGVVCLAARAHAAPPSDEAAPATGAIRFYQQYLSSLRHGHCQFDPSCSEYAVQAIAVYGLVAGSARAADRLIRCNASAARFHPRGADGRLEDPVTPALATRGGPRVPRWLLAPGEPPEPPVPSMLDPDRRARLDESGAFALRLEQRGDCERAAMEYQRVGSLAGTAETDSWAFARIGECQFAAANWSAAEGAFLASGMLATSRSGRATALYRAAVSSFNAGTFASCERLMADSTAAREGIPADRFATLGGLCALARGGWAYSAGELRRAAELSHDDESRARILRLVPFAARGQALPHRSAAVAGGLSAVIPGAGQVYCGRPADGSRHLLFNAALVWTVVSLARDHRGPAAYLTASVALPFYLGNVLGAQAAARRYDRYQRMSLLRNAITESER